MKLTVTCDDNVVQLDVYDDTDLENLIAHCEAELSMSFSALQLLHNAMPLYDMKKTLKQLGIVDGDMVLVVSKSMLQQAQNQQQQVPNQSLGQPSSQHLSTASSSGVTPSAEELLNMTDITMDQAARDRESFMSNPNELISLKLGNMPLADTLASGSLEEFHKVLNEQHRPRPTVTTRLVDYVAIVGFDFEANQRNAKGRILQRFPEKDWPDTSFIEGIEFFCQPLGWELKASPQDHQRYVPKFFQFVLTDIDVDRHYCACLTFYETVQRPTQMQQQQSLPSQEATLYAPKCIVLISRLDYREVFRNCLSIFYAVHVDNLRYSLENLIGNLLSTVRVPLYGGPSIRFSLSAGDCLALQPPKTATIPVTSTTVYRLVEHLGINNVVELFYALLTEHKILFYSQSYTRLNEACQGLISLMYPFKYSHTYIPILPATLIEFLSTPTPFIIGVHSSLKREISDLLDVIVVDIDGGSVKVPDSLHVARLEEPYNSQLVTLLIYITRPQIVHADDAFVKPCHAQPSSPDIMDKEIRAIFLRTITQILQGYRSCLSVIRIHPKSLISFHKASFLGQRGFVDNEFMTRLLESMFFEKFVEFRGLPYRDCDLFDELHATLHERLQEEQNDINAIIRHIKNLAHSLWEHENPASRPPNQKALKPTVDKANNIVTKPFPMLDSFKIADIIVKETRRNSETLSERSRSISTTSATITQQNGTEALEMIISPQCQFVPMGLSAEQVKSEFNANEFVINSARRLEVMRNCVNCIFDNKISDARKALPAVLKALKNKANRLALIDELACHLGSQRAVLEHQQFDLVVRLMNCALQHESHIDLNGVAAKILPLAMEFCRRLCTGVIQFAFTCIQDHPVWSNQQFWESSFYLDVEKDVIALYGPLNQNSRATSADRETIHETSFSGGEPNSSPSSSSTLNKTVINNWIGSVDSGLEVAYKQLQLLNKMPEGSRKDYIEKWSKDEESTVYSQAVHYANRIVCMKVPLDIATRSLKSNNNNNNDSQAPAGANSSQRTHSNGSDRNSNSDEESGFEDEANITNFTNSEVAASVVKFVTRFVDKVCIDSCVGEEHIRALHTMVPQVVAMQIETLESVYRESKRLPPVTKPKITNPDMIEGEEILMPGLRTYLLPDGRDKDNVKDESLGAHIGGQVFLPAEGGIFVTNYRVIFKGRPCDPFYCEQTVVRSFPTATLTKEKRITVHAVPAVDQYLQEGLQLRSNTFQLIRVAFDEEVTSESIDGFRKHVIRQRSPANIFQLFAFTSQLVVPNKSIMLMQKTKNPKSATLKGFAKRTFMKTAQKAGLKKKDPNKNRYIFEGFSGSSKDSRTLALGSTASSSSISDHLKSNEQADSLNESTTSSDHSQHQSSLHLTLPRSTLSSSTSVVNASPHIKMNQTSANTLAKMAQMNYVKDYFRLNLGNINSSNASLGGTTNMALSNFFQGSSNKNHRTYSNSNNSIDQCFITSVNLNYSVTRSYPGLVVVPSSITDDCIIRMSRFYKSGRFPAIVWRHARNKALLLRSSGFQAKGTFDAFKSSGQVLYIMTEKALIKSIKPEMHRSCEFIPLELHEVRQVKSNFVKFLRACVPSAPLPAHESESSLAKTVESLEWFVQLKSILECANNIVDLIDSQGKSVLLAIEEGWDLTPQITSIAQLCLDPYYRTFEGFRVLIEKEWLAFGHRFSHRSNHTIATPTSGFAPMFLQFLDLVHQLHRQFPLSFEFNQYYLKFLAYHHVSCRFRTFLLDCEAERSECGWLNEEIISPAQSLTSFGPKSNYGSSSGVSSGSNNSSSNMNAIGRHSRQASEVTEINMTPTNPVNHHQDATSARSPTNTQAGAGSNKTLTSTPINTIGTSFWDYADKLWNQSPIFFNYYYTPVNFLDPSKNVVLIPSSNIATFKLWDYYTSEDLIHGPSYDTEVFNMTRQHQEELQASTDQSKASKRRLVVTNYDSIHLTQPDGLTQSMGDIKSIEHEYNLNPSQWSNLWSKIETSLPVD